MSDMGPAEAVWREVDYAQAWAPFEARFDFRPDFHEHTASAIRLPEQSVVVDLSPVFANEGPRFAAGEAAINAAALRAFVWLGDQEELSALNWNHPAYRYAPAAHALSDLDWVVPVFPNGDYYVHTTHDLRWGTFGHPWQQSLCIWGDLVDSLGKELLTWLPKHAHSPT